MLERLQKLPAVKCFMLSSLLCFPIFRHSDIPTSLSILVGASLSESHTTCSLFVQPSVLPSVHIQPNIFNSIHIGLNTYHNMQQPSELYVIVQQPSGLHTVVQWVAADVCNQLLANMYITLLPVWYYMQWSLIYRYLCCSPRAKARGEGLGTGIP